MSIDVRDLRRNERFVVREALNGSFAGSDVTVVNVCEQGAMIAHLHPMRIGTRAKLQFHRGPLAAAASARIVWSHVVKHGPGGSLVYQSGLLIESDGPYLQALGDLMDQQVIAADADSLERKREKLERLENQKTAPGTMRVPTLQEPAQPDPTLLVRHALAKLKSEPSELHRLYLRARIDAADAVINGEPEDVIAVWEYLGRTIDIGVVDRALRRGK